MLDIALLTNTLAIGALIAATGMWLASMAAPRPWRRDACWSWAIGAGVLVASGANDQWPHWPALEDRARFLTLLVPLTLVVETSAAALRSRCAAWGLRLALAAAVAPILLYNSVYLADLDGHRSAEWHRFEAAMILTGMAALLAFTWAMLEELQRRTSTIEVHWILALDALATACTVMLSGYYRGGLLGLGLTGAIVGAATAACFVRAQRSTSGSVGMSVIGIFAVVLIGRFFGTLPNSLAVGLLLAPHVALVVELSLPRTYAPAWRATGRLAGVAMVLLVVITVAQQNFTAAFKARSKPAGQRSLPETPNSSSH